MGLHWAHLEGHEGPSSQACWVACFSWIFYTPCFPLPRSLLITKKCSFFSKPKRGHKGMRSFTFLKWPICNFDHLILNITYLKTLDRCIRKSFRYPNMISGVQVWRAWRISRIHSGCRLQLCGYLKEANRSVKTIIQRRIFEEGTIHPCHLSRKGKEHLIRASVSLLVKRQQLLAPGERFDRSFFFSSNVW